MQNAEMFKIEQISAWIQGQTSFHTQVSALEEVHLCKLNRFPFFRTDSGMAHTIQFASFVMQQLLQNGMKLLLPGMRMSTLAAEFAWMTWIGFETRQPLWNFCGDGRAGNSRGLR